MSTSNVAPSIQELALPIAALQPHPRNPRRGDVESIKESLQAFGQVRPIVVQGSTGYVVAGNHTMKAAAELGWDRLAVVTVDMSDDDALRYLLADNRTGDKGTYDDEALAGILEQMMDAGLLDGTGYTADDVDDIVAAAGAVQETAPQEFAGGYAEDPEETKNRWLPEGEGRKMREVILLVAEEDHEQFMETVKSLKERWGMESTRDVILEALTRSLSAQDEAPEGNVATAAQELLQ